MIVKFTEYSNAQKICRKDKRTQTHMHKSELPKTIVC